MFGVNLLLPVEWFVCLKSIMERANIGEEEDVVYLGRKDSVWGGLEEICLVFEGRCGWMCNAGRFLDKFIWNMRYVIRCFGFGRSFYTFLSFLCNKNGTLRGKYGLGIVANMEDSVMFWGDFTEVQCLGIIEHHGKFPKLVNRKDKQLVLVLYRTKFGVWIEGVYFGIDMWHSLEVYKTRCGAHYVINRVIYCGEIEVSCSCNGHRVLIWNDYRTVGRISICEWNGSGSKSGGWNHRQGFGKIERGNPRQIFM